MQPWSLVAVSVVPVGLAAPRGPVRGLAARGPCLDAYVSSLTTTGPSSGAPARGSGGLFQRQAASCREAGHAYGTARFDAEAYLLRAGAARLSERAAAALGRLRRRLLHDLSAEERRGLLSGFGVCLPHDCSGDACGLAQSVVEFFGFSFGLLRDSSLLPSPRWCTELNVSLPPAEGSGAEPFMSQRFCRGGRGGPSCGEPRARLAPEGQAWEGGLLGRPNRFCTSQLTVSCAMSPAAPATPPVAAEARAEKKRLAVLVVGVRERFYLTPTLKHVVAPAVAAGFEVHYFAALSWQPSHVGATSPWSKDWLQPVPNPSTVNLTVGALRDSVVRHAKHHGASRAEIIVFETVPLEELPPHMSSRKRYLSYASREHPAFVNALRRYKMTELLWNHAAATARSRDEEYSHVLLTRDDTYWVDDVHLEHFPDRDTVYSGAFGGLCFRAPIGSSGVPVPSDRALVLGGRAAGRFLDLYSEFRRNPSEELANVGGVEDYLFTVARLKGVPWKVVRNDWLPHFLAMHRRVPGSSASDDGAEQSVLCFRLIGRKLLEHPEAPCVHPDLVRHPFCEDF